MSDWTSGYVADIGYTYGYYAELNPLHVKSAFHNAGLVCPEIVTACELGFGQGMSANIHAAASAVQWHGTDFNPAQASFAQELAAISGSGAKLYDSAFAEFASRTDLPDFDYIGLHGIWSWISDENRAVIVDFIRRKLKVGGVLYISYNTLPGWSSFAPMRHLLTQHAEIIGSEGNGIISRIDGALEFAEKMIAVEPSYMRANPQLKDRFKRIKSQNRRYLAHEYFNRDWEPMYFSDMGNWLEGAKLNYACSAHYLDHVEILNLNKPQQEFLATIPDPMFKQSVRDYMVNQQFRRDYWVKGPRTLSSFDQAEKLRSHKVVLSTHRPDASLKVTGSLGEATMNAEVYDPILDLMADHKIRTVGQIEQGVRDRNVTLNQVTQAVLVLSGNGGLSSVQDDSVIRKAKPHTDKLNQYIMTQARGSNDMSYLASPVTGGGFAVGRFNQLFLLAQRENQKSPEDWAAYAWRLLEAQGQKLLKEGKPLDTSEENLAELAEQARAFAEKQLPILKALQIAQ